MCPRHEEVASHVHRRFILVAKTVHAVHHEQDAIILGTLAVRLRYNGREFTDGELHSGSGVCPRQSDDACFWRNRLSQAGRHLIDRHRVCAIVQAAPAAR